MDYAICFVRISLTVKYFIIGKQWSYSTSLQQISSYSILFTDNFYLTILWDLLIGQYRDKITVTLPDSKKITERYLLSLFE